MSKERQLSELKQEMQFLEVEKLSNIGGLELLMLAQDWLKAGKHIARLTEIDALLIIKNNQSRQLLLDHAEEQRLSILESV